MFAEAIRNVIIADAQIRARLATYAFGSLSGTTTSGGRAGEDAAVFTFVPAPSDARHPFVTVVETTSAPWGTRAQRGAESAVEISLWGDKTGRTDAALRELAWMIFRATHRAELALAGYEEWGCVANAPRSQRDADAYPGHVISVRVRSLERL